MQISEIKTYITWGDPRNWLFVKVITDEGVYGWGEGTLEGREEVVRTTVHDLGNWLIGQNPLHTEHLWQRLYRHGFWRGGVVLLTALAALDQALWDIKGKVTGMPVYMLLGGPTRKKLRLYTHVGIYDPSKMIDDAKQDVADGFTAMKTGAWPTLSELSENEQVDAMAERVRLLREAVGPKVDLMIDNHGKSRSGLAVRMMRALEPYRLLWFEEATSPDDIEELAALRAAGPQVNIATGERLYSKWEYRPLFERRLVDIIQPDLCHAGGITEVKKISAMAEAYSLVVAPHNPQGPVATAAAAHIAMSIPNFLILEYVASQPARDRVLREPWPIQDGHLEVPDKPGLGVDLNEEVLEAHPPRLIGVPRGAWNPDGSIADV